MRRVLPLLILIYSGLLYSQEETPTIYTVSGKIIDATTQKPLEDATIIFKSLNSEEIQFGGITNSRGRFSIDIKEGTYNATVASLSYISKNLNISSFTRDLNIGTIELEADTEYLNEVQIVAEKKTLEYKANKIVFNVDSDVSSAGSSVSDLLNNIPSVSVDLDGNISLSGNKNVAVMINGKTSYLSKTEALKSLPAGSIEKIEVITNPGANYKASILSVINIILKKGKNEGLNSSITSTGGYKDYYGGLITLNNKSKKMNFFTNMSYFSRNPIKVANSEAEYFSSELISSYLIENSENNRKDKGFYSTIGADFYLSDKNTLAASINYQNIHNNSNTLTTSTILDATKTTTTLNERTYLRKLKNELIEVIIDFEHSFKKEGQKLNSYLIYTIDSDNYDNSIINSNIKFTNEDFLEKNKLQNTIFETSYTHPITTSLLYKIGYNGEFGKIPFVFSETENDNKINYSENVHGVFLSFKYEKEKIIFDIGLRGEFSEAEIDYKSLNIVEKKRYNELFPSASFGYKISESKNLNLNLNRGIIRPTYSFLQPFEQKFSETTSYIGNPDLNPIFVDKAKLSYVSYGRNITFSPSLFFDRYNDFWQEVTFETGNKIDGVNKLITTPVNIGRVDHYGINITSTLRASNFLNFTGNATFYYFDQIGSFNTTNLANEIINLDYTNTSFNGNFSLLTHVKFSNIFEIQINAKHFLKSKDSYFSRKAYTYAGLSINKDLFNKEASISLTVDDIFKSQTINRDRFNSNYFSKSIIQNKFRTILLSFTYRFNQSKKDRRIDFNKKDIKPNY